MATPTAIVSSVVARATCLMSSSFAFGIARTTAVPTTGMNTARLSAQESNQSIGEPPVLPLGEEDQRPGQETDGGEEHEGVLLDAAGLHQPEDAAGLRRANADPVDDAVDALLVDDVIGEAAQQP